MNIDLERSLKDRIKAIAKAENRVFNDVWKSLALERFLVRLARSNKLDRFIFKGGFLLSKYLNLGRETADLDFSLRATDGSIESIKAEIQEILSLPYDDGFSFVDIAVQEMRHPHMEYPGFEVALVACLGNTKTHIRIDLGIGVSTLTKKGRCSPTKPNVNNPPIKYSNPNPPPRPRPHFLRVRNFLGSSKHQNVPKRKERVECQHHSTLFVLSPVKRVSPAANRISIGQNHYDQVLSRHKPATT